MFQKISDPPRLSGTTVQDCLIYKYGLQPAEIKNLVSDIGQNFFITDQNQNAYVFKIANRSESFSILEVQNAVLEYLNKQKINFKVPQVLNNLEGNKITEIKLRMDQLHYARLLSYLPGEFLAHIRFPSAKLLKNLGHVLATLDKSLQQFSHPAMQRDWHWDLQNIMVLCPLTNFIKDPSKKRLVEYFLLQFDIEVRTNFPRLRKSLIHNDGNDHNILVNQENKTKPFIYGIIDFGDMVYSYTIFDLAVALAYIMLDKKDPLSSVLPVIQGYHEILPLQEVEVDVLFYSICARLCQSVAMSAYQQNRQPDNAYVSITENSAWRLLEQLLEINPEKARLAFRTACSMDSVELKTNMLKSIMEERKTYLGKSLSVSYKKPLIIIRGAMQYLYDLYGQTYLDCVNNVCHVGHAHPVVVKAAQHQIAVLNTNTRYLHDFLIKYAKRLTDTLPDPLKVCFFVNSGSEANELALRLAYTHTNRKNVIVIDHAYFGNTSSLIDISPYKFDGKGGRGPGSYTHKVVMPDPYRGPYKSSDPDAGLKYARHVTQMIDQLKKNKQGLAAFIAESLPGCAGQIVLPAGYLEHVYHSVRGVGGLCIADEVQVGFGRVGTNFWGFELQNVVPDIVTMGKPIGNGHPLGAVVCSYEIADSFMNGMEYFNTFGGNPVSCATGMAVLDVIKEENLQENALQTGKRMMDGFTDLKSRYSLIGDVRGAGLFIGIELVSNRDSLQPATDQAAEIVEKMKDEGILLSTDGPFENVIKIKPPMVFNKENADRVVEKFEFVLKSID